MQVNIIRKTAMEYAHPHKIFVDHYDDFSVSVKQAMNQVSDPETSYKDISIVVDDSLLLPVAPSCFHVDSLNFKSWKLYFIYMKPHNSIIPIIQYKNVILGNVHIQVPTNTIRITVDCRGRLYAWPTNDIIYVESIGGYSPNNIDGSCTGTHVGNLKGTLPKEPYTIWGI